MGNNSEMFQIATEEQYRWAQTTLNQQNRPAMMLRLIMGAFEAYRRARKYGWSRAWNKYNVLNFQSFKLRPIEDAVLINMAEKILGSLHGNMPDEAKSFADDLLHDTQNLMGFIFIHEITELDARYEGATISLGRVNGRRYRDRLDIVLESNITSEISQGLQRVRVFVDPYRAGEKAPLWQTVAVASDCPPSQALFDELSRISFEWEKDTQRWWQHWTSAYIDYFGPRRWKLTHSYFFTPPEVGVHDELNQKKAAC